MYKKSILIIILSALLPPSLLLSQVVDQGVTIKDIYEKNAVLDEYSKPGLYSPVNVLDDNQDTCFAVGNNKSIELIILFKQPIKCDEIKILGGITKNNNLYDQNNRPKDINIYIFDSESGFITKENLRFEKKYNLDDTMNYQSLNLDGPQNIQNICIQSLNHYSGTKYSDTCITEIKFFYKGKEIRVNDIEQEKKNYIIKIKDRFKSFFDLGKFEVEEWNQTATIKPNGDFISKLTIVGDDYNNTPIPVTTLSKIYIRDSKLYIILKGKEELANYLLLRYPRMPRLVIYNAIILPNGKKVNMILRHNE